KGNRVIHGEGDIPEGVEGFFEEMIDFEREVSVIACRGITGESVIYPIAENAHRNSILDTTIVPARISGETAEKAREIADRVMRVFEGVGTFCVEMFVTKSGDVLVNEVAPRPHNSGHYTIEGCFANQFENHIRAILSLPLGNAELLKPAVMVNLLGESDGTAKIIGLEEAYGDSDVHVHLYGKAESKIGRKMGHFTLLDDDLGSAIERAVALKSVVKIVGDNSEVAEM
ncbi:MAG: ATP-grasp domain-containing protein, partial [Oscillospiraceae bacterium]|nr:ATP-grasp domain-containing protein [Oscillospiraceae bacterium]